MTVSARLAGGRVHAPGAAHGRVLSVHAYAINILVADRGWTLVGAGQPGGARRIELITGAPLTELPVAAGDTVALRGGYLRVGGVVVDLRTAVTWTQPPTGPVPAEILPALEDGATSRAWEGTSDLVDQIVCALDDDTALLAALLRVVGRGPGLTPSGDDAIAGLAAGLLGDSSPRAEQRLGRLRELLPLVWDRTTTLSRVLLHDVLDGDLSDPLATVLCPTSSTSARDAAVAELLAAGATSGADLCLGLASAARLSVEPERISA